MADETTIPAAAWHDWRGERWAVSTAAMFREGMPVVTLPPDGYSRWYGPNDRRATEAELDKAVAPPPAPPMPDPWVHPNYAPAFAAAARVIVWHDLMAIRLLDADGNLCGVVMPVRGPADAVGCVRLSTLCAYEVDRG